MCRPKPVPSRRVPQVTRLTLDDAALGQQGLHPNQVSSLPEQCRQQTWLVGRSHAPIILHICVYAVAGLVAAEEGDQDDNNHDDPAPNSDADARQYDCFENCYPFGVE